MNLPTVTNTNECITTPVAERTQQQHLNNISGSQQLFPCTEQQGGTNTNATLPQFVDTFAMSATSAEGPTSMTMGISGTTATIGGNTSVSQPQQLLGGPTTPPFVPATTISNAAISNNALESLNKQASSGSSPIKEVGCIGPHKTTDVSTSSTDSHTANPTTLESQDAANNANTATTGEDTHEEDQEESGGVNLFIAGLLPSTTKDHLYKMFAPYGEIESTKVVLDTRTGKSRGFGFVLFVRSEDGHKALEALHSTKMGTSRLFITVSQHDGKVEESQRLYIRNIPLGVPEEDIRNYFMQFGETTMFLLREGNGSFGVDGSRHTQHLTIQYVSLEDAKRALAACHGSTPFPGSTSPILAKYSEVTHTRQNNRRPPGGVRPTQNQPQVQAPPPMYQPPQPMMMQPMMYAPVMQPNGQAMMQPMMMMQPQPMMVPAGQPMMAPVPQQAMMGTPAPAAPAIPTMAPVPAMQPAQAMQMPMQYM